MLEAIT